MNNFTGVTTLYVDGLYERESTATLTTHVHYIVAGGEAVAIYKSRSDSVQSTRYLHRDHLGSVTHLTDETGTARTQCRADGNFTLDLLPFGTPCYAVCLPHVGP